MHDEHVSSDDAWEPRNSDDEVGPVLISAERIAARVHELGAQITVDLAGHQPLFVGVLKGAFVFLADLVRCVDLPLEIDFMAVSSYGVSTTSTGVVRIVSAAFTPVRDQLRFPIGHWWVACVRCSGRELRGCIATLQRKA